VGINLRQRRSHAQWKTKSIYSQARWTLRRRLRSADSHCNIPLLLPQVYLPVYGRRAGSIRDRLAYVQRS